MNVHDLAQALAAGLLWMGFVGIVLHFVDEVYRSFCFWLAIALWGAVWLVSLAPVV